MYVCVFCAYAVDEPNGFTTTYIYIYPHFYDVLRWCIERACAVCCCCANVGRKSCGSQSYRNPVARRCFFPFRPIRFNFVVFGLLVRTTNARHACARRPTSCDSLLCQLDSRATNIRSVAAAVYKSSSLNRRRRRRFYQLFGVRVFGVFFLVKHQHLPACLPLWSL